MDYFRVRAYIDEEALRHNIRVCREKIGKDVLLMGVVKANAYGHGIENVVPVLEEEGVDAYAVATLEEGLQVRRFTKKMILILGYTDPDQYEEALNAQISLTIYTRKQAEKLSQTALNLQTTAAVHIKLETGMGRIGFQDDLETLESIDAIYRLPAIQIEGMFTHFARADEVDKSKANKQLEQYAAMLSRLQEKGITIPIYHTANSAAIMELAQAFQLPTKSRPMVRAGIMMYGLYPSLEMDRQQTKLEPVLSLKSHIIHIKDVEAGTPIGYGGTYVAPEKRRIATIPVGYGDGYPRRLSNQGYVRIHGQKAPITGRVCMDQLMVDITDIESAQLGDEVLLIGEGVSAQQLADQTDTIHYEIVCQLTGRVPRVMKRKGKTQL